MKDTTEVIVKKHEAKLQQDFLLNMLNLREKERARETTPYASKWFHTFSHVFPLFPCTQEGDYLFMINSSYTTVIHSSSKC